MEIWAYNEKKVFLPKSNAAQPDKFQYYSTAINILSWTYRKRVGEVIKKE
jgi:hypothetical protein